MKLISNFLKAVALFVFFIPFTSCVHYYYAPNAHNVPLLKEKNETKLLVALSGGDEFTGFETQFASAVNDKIGIMANFITASGDNDSESGSGTYFEVGLGYFKPLGQKFVFETYGGVGLGSVKNKYSLGDSKVKFTRLFIQPNIGFSTRGFEVAFSSRFAGLNFHAVEYSSIELYDEDDLEYIKNNKFSFLFEPALTIRGGWEQFKIQLQLVHSKNINNKNLLQEEGNINIGFYFDIASRK